MHRRGNPGHGPRNVAPPPMGRGFHPARPPVFVARPPVFLAPPPVFVAPPRHVFIEPVPAFIAPLPIGPTHHTSRRSYSNWLPALPEKLFFTLRDDMLPPPKSQYWTHKVHALLGANWFAKQFRKLFGLNDLTKQLESEYLSDIADRTDTKKWEDRFQEVYEKTTGFFGGIKRFLMGLTFFKSRSEAFGKAFAELEDPSIQTHFKKYAEDFNGNTVGSLLDSYDALQRQVNDTPIKTTVDEDIRLGVAPVIMRGPGGRPHVRPALRPQVRTRITREIDDKVIDAQKVYNRSQGNFCTALDRLAEKYPHIMGEERRQGRLPQKPPRISL